MFWNPTKIYKKCSCGEVIIEYKHNWFTILKARIFLWWHRDEIARIKLEKLLTN